MTREEAKDDLGNIIKVKKMRMKMNEVNECLALTEEILMTNNKERNQTQEQLLELKTKNMQLEDRISATNDDLDTGVNLDISTGVFTCPYPGT